MLLRERSVKNLIRSYVGWTRSPGEPFILISVTRVMEMLISCIKSRLKRMHSCGINHLGQLGVLHLSTREKPWTESTRSLHQTHPCLQDGSGYARLLVLYTTHSYLDHWITHHEDAHPPWPAPTQCSSTSNIIANLWNTLTKRYHSDVRHAPQRDSKVST